MYFQNQEFGRVPRPKTTGREMQEAIRSRSSMANNGMWGVPQLLGSSGSSSKLVDWLSRQLGWMLVIGFGPVIWGYVWLKTRRSN